MILNFEDEVGERHFEFCFVGFILGGSLEQTKGLTRLRKEMQILGKLESISEEMPCGKKLINEEPKRQLIKKNGQPRQINLDPPEFDILYNYISQVPWQSGNPTRYAVETIDWLERSQKMSHA